jgi:general secretion pathway protein L
MLGRLRPAAWIAGAALALHAVALLAHVAYLGHERQALRERMEARFRGVFPEAVAVVDPALQMRRKLAEARRAAGVPDPGDFLPLLAQVSAGAAVWPQGAVRGLSFEAGRMTLDFTAVGAPLARGVEERLKGTGAAVRLSGAGPGGSAVTLTVLAP